MLNEDVAACGKRASDTFGHKYKSGTFVILPHRERRQCGQRFVTALRVWKRERENLARLPSTHVLPHVIVIVPLR